MFNLRSIPQQTAVVVPSIVNGAVATHEINHHVVRRSSEGFGYPNSLPAVTHVLVTIAVNRVI